ncbi:MAG: hypothetical protein QM802_10515 [Agriterribacter sp.]
MKQVAILFFAISVICTSCGGDTPSGYTIDSSDNNIYDSTHKDSSMPKDTVYPKTDTNSYRKDKDTANKSPK